MWIDHNSSSFGNELKLCQLQQDCWFIRNLEKHTELGTDRSVSHTASKVGNIKCMKRLFLRMASANCKNRLEIFSNHKRGRSPKETKQCSQTPALTCQQLWISLENASVGLFCLKDAPLLNHQLTTPSKTQEVWSVLLPVVPAYYDRLSQGLGCTAQRKLTYSENILRSGVRKKNKIKIHAFSGPCSIVNPVTLPLTDHVIPKAGPNIHHPH